MRASRRARNRWLPLLAGAFGLMLAAGCTTVPTSSPPDVVRSIDVGAPGPDIELSPGPNDGARAIVIGFLEANALNEPNHASARRYLTTEERTRWSDSTITVIDSAQVSNVVDDKVTVTGQEIGTVDDTGVYTPKLRGDGTGVGGVTLAQTFGMRQMHGQWRIDSLPKGLLLSVAQFQQYQQRKLYFFDLAEERLVPDPRYTQLSDPRDLAVWLIARLAEGPRGGLQTGLPAQTDPKQVQPEIPPGDPGSGPLKIEIPGAGQLDTTNLDRLGAQIAATLGQVPQIDQIQITDGGEPVRVPAAGGATFTASQLAGQFEIAPPDSELFYVRGGGVIDQRGHRLPGKVGAGAYGLTSVALTRRQGTADLLIAGVRGSGNNETLDLGTSGQLVATKVHGRLSRPAWAPGLDEVWIGDGSNLYRVSASGTVQVVQVDAAVGKATGTVTAVRLSPEGARVALVLTSADGSQIYVGSVVRGAKQVRVADLTPISPQGVAVTDVAWNDQLKLFTIGRDLRSGEVGVYEVQCDGSLWIERGTANLPGPPDSITVAANSVAAVSTGNTVWRQRASSWEGLLGGDETFGTNPIYVE